MMLLHLTLMLLLPFGAISLEVLMPEVTTTGKDTYLCTYKKVEDHMDGNFIVGFKPKATMKTAHHMLVYLCDLPGSFSDFWGCGHGVTEGVENANVCNSRQVRARLGCLTKPPDVSHLTKDIIYAWGRDAPALELPADTGFLVNKNRYIVMQVHYKDAMTDPDTSGVLFNVTSEPQPRLAAVSIMGHNGQVPPHKTVYLDMICPVETEVTIHPFAYRTHAHHLGRVISGYKVDGKTKEWSLLGKMDPREPQMFYPVADTNLVLDKGDYLAARCTMVSDRDRVTMMGMTDQDEMCNFYLMYYVENSNSNSSSSNNNNNNDDIGCWSGATTKWAETFGSENLPKDASEFNGITYAES